VGHKRTSAKARSHVCLPFRSRRHKRAAQSDFIGPNVVPEKFDRRSPETIGDEKSPQFAGLFHPKKEILKNREWMAGVEGIELTHSCSNQSLDAIRPI
jgi:hypothetical protein